MQLRCALIVATMAVLAPGWPALAQQPAKALSTERVAEAIEFGKAHSVAEIEAAYKLHEYLPILTVETPFSRVAKATAEANEKAQVAYKPFKAPLITPAMKAPGITIHAIILPDFQKPFTDVKNVVIMPAGKTERSDAIQATRKTPMTSSLRNAAGGRVTATSIAAEFPESVLADGNEIRIVYTFIGTVMEEVLKLDAGTIARLK